MENKALSFLEKNLLLHMSMIYPINRGTAEIIYAEDDGVFIREKISNAYMLSVNSFHKGKELLELCNQLDLVCVHQKNIADYLMKEHKYTKQLSCLQAVYLSKKYVQKSTNLEIKELGLEYLDTIYKHYHDYVDIDYIQRRLESGEIYGGFLDNELCGFVGTHEEGSIGILEVFSQFRNRGFGQELESFMVNRILDKNQTPFAQISIENEKSVRLHRKLGFEISLDQLHWLF